MADPTETTSKAAEPAAEDAGDFARAVAHDRRMEAAKLALAFLTRGVAGLGETYAGDEDSFKRDNLLAHYEDVERAYRAAAVDALRLLSHAFREARRP